MASTRRWGVRAASILSGVLMAALAVAASGSATAAPADARWHTPAVRFEALDPGTTFSVAGVGQYRGALDVVRTPAGLATVNELGLEEYLLGMAEVPPSWPIEAQKAQAVAARTYALYEREGRRPTAYRAAGADICATEACQVYLGVEGEAREGAARWAEAVRATAGEVLLHGDRPIRAKYSASNGGRSIAGGAPYLRAAPDPHDAAVSPYARWRWSLSLEQLAALFPADGALVSVWPAEAGVVLGRHHGDGTASEQVISRWEFRSHLNERLSPPPGLPRPVPSPMFDARMEGDGVVVIDGRGYGHGVGMSQYGAMGKARSGWSHVQILAAYYGGITPVTLPAERLPGRLRVAVALDLSRATVTASGPFRVVAADGTPLAHSASGAWEVRPIPAAVEVAADGADDARLALRVHDVRRASAPGASAIVSLDLNMPALVRVRLDGSDGAGIAIGLLAAGRHDVPVALPATARTLVVHADAGGGRTAAARAAVADPRAPHVRPVAAAAPTATRGAPSRSVVGALAAVVVLATGTAAVARIGTLRRSRPPAGT